MTITHDTHTVARLIADNIARGIKNDDTRRQLREIISDLGGDPTVVYRVPMMDDRAFPLYLFALLLANTPIPEVKK
jgi:hypothetical protein